MNIASKYRVSLFSTYFASFQVSYFSNSSLENLLIILKNSIDLFFLLFLQGLARNLEQPEIKDWLNSTKDMLMGDKSGKDQEKAAEQLNGTLQR